MLSNRIVLYNVIAVFATIFFYAGLGLTRSAWAQEYPQSDPNQQVSEDESLLEQIEIGEQLSLEPIDSDAEDDENLIRLSEEDLEAGIEIDKINKLSLDLLGISVEEGGLESPWRDSSSDDLIAMINRVNINQLPASVKKLATNLLLSGGAVDSVDNSDDFLIARMSALLRSGRASDALRLIELLPPIHRQEPRYKNIEIESLLVLARFDEACIEIEQFLRAGDINAEAVYANIACHVRSGRGDLAATTISVMVETQELEELKRQVQTALKELSIALENLDPEAKRTKDSPPLLGKSKNTITLSNKTTLSDLFLFQTLYGKNRLKKVEQLTDAPLVMYLLSYKETSPLAVLEASVARNLLGYKNFLRLLATGNEKSRNLYSQIIQATKNEHITQTTLQYFLKINCSACIKQLFTSLALDNSASAKANSLKTQSIIVAIGQAPYFFKSIVNWRAPLRLESSKTWPILMINILVSQSYDVMIRRKKRLENALNGYARKNKPDKSDTFYHNARAMLGEVSLMIEAVTNDKNSKNPIWLNFSDDDISNKKLGATLLSTFLQISIGKDEKKPLKSKESTIALATRSLSSLGFVREAALIASEFLARPRGDHY